MDLSFAYGNGIQRQENSSQEGSTDRLAGYKQWAAIKELRQSSSWQGSTGQRSTGKWRSDQRRTRREIRLDETSQLQHIRELKAGQCRTIITHT